MSTGVGSEIQNLANTIGFKSKRTVPTVRNLLGCVVVWMVQ